MRDLPATVALLNDLQELLKDDGLKQLLGTFIEDFMKLNANLTHI